MRNNHGVSCPGHKDIDAHLVLHNLRPAMLAAIAYDATAELLCAYLPALCGEDQTRRPSLNSHLEGSLKLWPMGQVNVKCVMAAPLDVAGLPLPVVNTCQAKVL